MKITGLDLYAKQEATEKKTLPSQNISTYDPIIIGI
jgi:hypothetical protein